MRWIHALKRFYLNKIDQIKAIVDPVAESDQDKKESKDAIVFDLLAEGRWQIGEWFLAVMITGSRHLDGSVLIGLNMIQSIARI